MNLLLRLPAALLLCALLGIGVLPALPGHAAPPLRKVEVFDIDLGKVVARLDNNEDIQQEARRWVKAITGPAVRPMIDPKHGIIIKVPVQPEVQVSNEWMKDSVVDVFLPVSPATLDTPLLLLFTKDNKPLMFTFKYDLRPFLKQYGLERYFNKPKPAGFRPAGR